MEVDERARAGLFLAMQYPSEISGVTNAEFLRSSINARREEGKEISLMKFIREMDKKMELLEMDPNMAQRYLNEGFSGGEKKRNEILQLMMIEPKIAILDEIDSGLDIDALRVVSKGINEMRSSDFGCLIITHYQRLLNYITPDHVHVMMQGRIVKSGGPELAQRLEAEGYDWIKDGTWHRRRNSWPRSISVRRIIMTIETKMYDRCRSYIRSFSQRKVNQAGLRSLDYKL